MRKFAFVIGSVLAVGWGAAAQAEIVTTFQDALQPVTPAPGWSYSYNGLGPIGDPANYTALLPTTDPYVWYNDNGVNGLPGPDPGGYVYFGLVGGGPDEGQAGGHPGRAEGQSGSGGIERFAIAAYTLSVGGPVSIVDSLLTNADTSQEGLDLRIFVNSNPTPIFIGSTAPGQGSSLTFDTSLGTLDAGDTIYVAIGSGTVVDYNDSFSLDYGISVASVPEPASVTLMALGCTCLVVHCRGWRRTEIIA